MAPPFDSLYRYLEPATQASTRTKYNRNKELYAPSSRTATTPDTLELDFYSSTTRPVAPYRTETYQYGKSTYNNKQEHGNTSRSVTRSQYSNAYSEDEGIVVNSESDSSVSQFATYDNRSNYTVPGQSAQPTYDTYSKYDYRAQPVRSTTFDYSNHTWRRNNGDIYAYSNHSEKHTDTNHGNYGKFN